MAKGIPAIPYRQYPSIPSLRFPILPIIPDALQTLEPGDSWTIFMEAPSSYRSPSFSIRIVPFWSGVNVTFPASTFFTSPE